MLLTHPRIVRLTGLLASWLVKGWIGSLDFRFVISDPLSIPQCMPTPGVYAFWHEMLMIPAYTHSYIIHPLVSRSRDGELISQVIGYLGGRPIRGSTNYGREDRGGIAAAWEMIRTGRRRHVGLTVDGPIGPQRKVSRGALVIASRHDIPIIPVGFGMTKCRHLGLENLQIALPYPYSRVWVVVGQRLRIRPKEWEAGRQTVQAALDDVQARAEQLAARNTRIKNALTLNQIRAYPENGRGSILPNCRPCDAGR
jgi:hypothetical protein